MLTMSDLKVGTKIEYEQEPYEIIRASHSKMGRQGAVLRTKLKNLKTGGIKDVTFRESDRFDEPDIRKEKAQYLYREGDSFQFMNMSDYDQFSLGSSSIGDLANFLLEGCEVEIIYYRDQAINIDLPIKVDFKVTEAPPALRGNTADGGTKKVKIETGYELNVPLFIGEGDTIKINTKEGTYVERVDSK